MAMSLRQITGRLKPWQSILTFIAAVAVVVGIGAGIRSCVKKGNDCQAYLNVAEEAFSRDDFDTALERLNTARQYCDDDKDIDARYLRIETLKEAAAYDQVRVVKDPTILKKIKNNLDVLLEKLGDTTDLLMLKAVYEELMDRPNAAVGIFEEIDKKRGHYANVYNQWGHTIVKWKLGGAGWSDQALEKFKQAANLKRDYGWPHVNMAAVYLELADNALSSETPDLDGASRYLPNAKASLEAAEKLLPTNPRVDLLWGHYYVIQALILKERKLPSDAYDRFSDAKDKLMQSKIKNDQIADARVLLGSVYLEQRMIDAAFYELREAVKLDEMNLTACARLVFGLSEKQKSHPDVTESGEIAAQIKRGLALIDTLRKRFAARSLETPDLDARQWLATAVTAYEPLEKFFKDAEQANAVAQAKPKPKPKAK